MRQLLTESVVLSLAGGVLGIVLGIIGIRALLAVNTAGLPRIGQDGALVGVDWRVLLFTLGVSLGTGILFGLIPAVQGSRADLSSTLKESAGRSGTGFRQNKARSLLVVIEVALALILLIGSALLIRTAVALGRVDPGFDARNVLTMRMSLTGPRFLKSEGVEQMVRDGVERLRAVPGVVAASATCCVPLQGGYGLPFVIVGRPPPADGPYHGGGSWVTISPGYFDVFKIPVKRGRAFNERDTQTTPGVVIINETMARQFWQKGDPLNDRLVIGRGVMREFAAEPERQIIGIVGDVRNGGLNNDPGPMMYIPQAQVPDAANALNVGLTPISWVVRTQVEPRSRERGRSGAAAAGERPAGVRRQDDERCRVDVDLAPAVQHVADDGIRSLGPAARGDRHLRADGLLGRAADAGDRHPPRARSAGDVGKKHDRPPGDDARARRRRRGRWVGVSPVALCVELSLWRHRHRPADFCRRTPRAERGRASCRVAARAPGQPHRSDHCFARRVESYADLRQ